MQKKYNFIIFLIASIIFITLIIVVIRSSPPWHFTSKDIGFIQIRQNGNTIPVNISDAGTINSIIEGLNHKKYKFTGLNFGIGWTYRILIYNTKGRLLNEFELDYNDNLSYSFGVYSYDDTDITFITDLFN